MLFSIGVGLNALLGLSVKYNFHCMGKDYFPPNVRCGVLFGDSFTPAI